MQKTGSSPQKKQTNSVFRFDPLAPWIGALLAILIAVAVKWTLGQIETQLRHQVGESLRTVVATTSEGIELWVDAIEAEVSSLVHAPDLIAAVQNALKNPTPAAVVLAPIRRLQQVLNPVFGEYRYTGFAVVGRDGGIIAESGFGGTPETSWTDAGAVVAALTGGTVIRLLSGGEGGTATSLVAAPIRDQADHIIAALVLFLDPTPGLTAITRLGRPGSTGETYVFARDGRILTGSRFKKSEGSVVAAPTSSAGGDESGRPHVDDSGRLLTMATTSLYPEVGVDVHGYLDYRGIPVLGAWSWMDRLSVGIATEVDRNEAMASFRTIRMLTVSMLTVVAVSLLGLLVMLISRGHIRASNYALARAAAARREVLGMVSHDLRSPLHHVLLSTDLIGAARDRETIDKAATAIRRTGRRMERLIADLLDVFEIGEGRLRIEKKPCDVAALLADVGESFEDEARLRGVGLLVDCPPDIGLMRADHERMVQVFSNLVTNAFKFTPRGGIVSVRAKSLGLDMRFEVSDTGPGIPKEDLSRVFEQFFRATPSSMQAGRGLGLYIAKVLVECHGGRIWAESNAERGAAFFFTIPR